MLNDEETKFIADDMVGKLSKWLRILGYDVVYYRSIEDKQLVSIANSEKRILLTRDTNIAESGKVWNCMLLESDNYMEQLRQIFRLLNLRFKEGKLFSRCLICGEMLKEISKEEVKGKVPPFVFDTQKRFVFCDKCNKIFWKGTHNDRVEETLRACLLEFWDFTS